MIPQKLIDELKVKMADASAKDILSIASQTFGQRICFATSLGEEDQVLTDMIAQAQLPISIFTLDTGRLFPEMYDLLDRTQKKYRMKFQIMYPDTQSVEQMVQEKGINLFYESVLNRKLCCGVRKVAPLKRALNNVDAWITGLRRAQSVTRTQAEIVEWDDSNQKIKINPLIAWDLEQLHQYIKENKVEVSSLHKQGFVSIGCAPCTRAIQPGDDIRSGRWWWETPEQKECGLHNNPNRPKKL